MSGLDVVRRLRAGPETENAVFVVCTAMGEADIDMFKKRCIEPFDSDHHILNWNLRRLDPICASTGAGDGIGVATMITFIWNVFRSNGPGCVGQLVLKTRVETEVFHAIGNA